MATLLLVLTTQVGWFVAVCSVAGGSVWPAAVAAIAAWSVRRRLWRHPSVRLLPLAALGTAIDLMQIGIGSFHLAADSIGWIGELLWFFAQWLVFVTTLDTAFAGLAPRRWLLAALGGIGGPAAYLGAGRLGAVQLPADPQWALLAIATQWALALPWMTNYACAGLQPEAPR